MILYNSAFDSSTFLFPDFFVLLHRYLYQSADRKLCGTAWNISGRGNAWTRPFRRLVLRISLSYNNMKKTCYFLFIIYLIYLYIYVKYIIKLYFCILNLNRTSCFIDPRPVTFRFSFLCPLYHYLRKSPLVSSIVISKLKRFPHTMNKRFTLIVCPNSADILFGF